MPRRPTETRVCRRRPRRCPETSAALRPTREATQRRVRRAIVAVIEPTCVERRSSEAWANIDWRSALRDAAGSTVLGVGLLYGAGSVIKLGQLNDAGLDGPYVLPLVPIQQLLLLGISEILPWVVFGLVVAAGVLFLLPHSGGPPSERKRAAWWVVVGLFASGAVLSAVIASSVGVFLGLTVGVVCLCAVSREKLSGKLALATTALALTSFIAFEQGFNPAPLPAISITDPKTKRVSRGSLVAHNGATWFVSDNSGRVRAFLEIESSRIRIFVARSNSGTAPFRAFR